jgi:serine/threonine protein phosphatase 1
LLDVETYRLNGGGWFLELPEERQAIFGAAFSALPYVIEVETLKGIVGILHADCPVRDWHELPAALERKSGRMHTIWSRVRIESADESRVDNVYAVLAGHTPLREIMALGNVIHIDTAGWMEEGHFTLLNLAGIRW